MTDEMMHELTLDQETLAMPRLNTTEAEQSYERLESIANMLRNIALILLIPAIIFFIIGAALKIPVMVDSIPYFVLIGIMLTGVGFFLTSSQLSMKADRAEQVARQLWVKEIYGLDLTVQQVDTLFNISTKDSLVPTVYPNMATYGIINVSGAHRSIEAVVTNSASPLGPGVHLIELGSDDLKELPRV